MLIGQSERYVIFFLAICKFKNLLAKYKWFIYIYTCRTQVILKQIKMSTLQAKNEVIVDAPVSEVWSIITNIELLPKINPGVLTATGRMDVQGAIRTCEMMNRGKKGSMTEKLVEFVPETKTEWTIQNDSMGMSKMLKEPRFCFYLEKISDHRTRLINESYYDPANTMVRMMNALFMKKKMGQIQQQILNNIKSLAENKMP